MRIVKSVDVNQQPTKVIVITDTGVGTTTTTTEEKTGYSNLRAVLDHQFNPDGEASYLVVLSHCHYDHILGLDSLLDSNREEDSSTTSGKERWGRSVTVVSSSYDRQFVTPYSQLMENSLCNAENLIAPHYETSIWAGDNERIMYEHPSGTVMHLPILTIHTPGHTPDSLSWYDTEERVLYVGDSMYGRVSDDTQNAPWGPEPPAPILFPNEGDLVAWWRSLTKLQNFVEMKNLESDTKVILVAGHVTAMVDAYSFLISVKSFFAKLLRNELLFREQPLKRHERLGIWRENTNKDGTYGEFFLGAPLRLVKTARENIPNVEWREGVI